MKTIHSESFDKRDLEYIKDVRPGRSVHYRSNETPDDVFQQILDDELSGKAEKDKNQELDDVWLDALRKQKLKEKQESVFAFVANAKNKK